MISLNSHFIHSNTTPIQEYLNPNQSAAYPLSYKDATQPGQAYYGFQTHRIAGAASEIAESNPPFDASNPPFDTSNPPFDVANPPFDASNLTFASEMALSNDTFTEFAEIPYYIKATSMTFCIVIMCLGVIGNVMVPIVILKTKDMRNSTNIFLVNLSIADLMVLLVCTPTVLVEVNSKPETWVLGKELCLAVPFVELTVAHASVLTILAISFERYYAICEPLRAGYVCTKTRATLICALAWFFAALFTSPILAIAEHRIEEKRDGRLYGQCLTQAVSFWPIFFFTMIILFLFILPLIILIVLYSIIAKNLITAASKVVMNKTVDPYNTRARKQVILMLGTVVLCFFLCLMPFRILTMWILIAPTEHMEHINPEKYFNILYFSRIMLYINSAINPILYNLMSSKFRIGFCKMCLCYRSSAEVVQNRRAHRNRAGTLTTGSTTSSSLTRTTNSLKKLFSNRSSLDRSNTTKSDTDSESNNASLRSAELAKEPIPKPKHNGVLDIFRSKNFIRQQSAPICTNSRTDVPSKINRMLSEGNVLELSGASALDVANKVNLGQADMRGFIGNHSEVAVKIRPDIETECPMAQRGHGSLRRSVLLNSAKARSVDDQCRKSTRKFGVNPILAVATFTYEEYEDGTVVPVCLTQADTFWSALFFILTIAVFFIIPLAVLLVLYSVIAKNLMENPVIISQHSKGNQNAGNVLRYRKQVILMLGTVVLSFFVCLLPFKALTLWIIVFPPETIMSLGLDGYYILLYFCRVMLYLNSAINPILYNLMSSKFREGFVKLLKINKLMRCSRNLRENMQRRDTFNTTTSTGFSSSQHTSDSFWRRYSGRTSSQKNSVNRVESRKAKELPETNVQQIKVGEIINVENTRRNSMKIMAAMAELDDDVQVEINDDHCPEQAITDDDDESTASNDNNKQIQILNLDVKTNNVYSITLDVSEKGEGRNRFVCVPVQSRESKNIFVYDFKSKESFV